MTAPTRQIKFIAPLRKAYQQAGARLSDQYAWCGITADGKAVLTAEVNHIDAADNVYSHQGGTFAKRVRGLAVARGDSAITTRHSDELRQAVASAYETGRDCLLLLLKGTRYSTDHGAGSARAAIDGNYWRVVTYSGTTQDGYEFELQRTDQPISGEQ